ncbi:Homoserine dehydrogenase [Liberibacter crescens BT-1]|uniref:Homoserine dehydrogenase n=1 Tax=Liberibacter crescens (strain BT-1) TaxID=1215343 RepID=L0ESF0_LIBCB|nr:homoserine dehydrogenase [Liberibacter crescens]AGA64434.1 Homoserine dehydrogenase [Liberibacter crescens BT-1]AMC12615.1 homoserine dehydrogenase [Liberibacter crescens]
MEDTFKIGIAGLGTVGTSLIRIINQYADRLSSACGRPIVISAVSARNRDLDRGIDLTMTQWFDDPVVMAREADIDVFVELIGGEGNPAHDAVRMALLRGCHVVTANKALLAVYGADLAILAENNGALFNFEAAVAGAVPIIKVLRDSLAGNAVLRIHGILNGTCNYILSQMENTKLPFEDCLKEAQQLGYAEVDPSFDISGADSAHKLAILASMAFGVFISSKEIHFEGISKITLEDIEAAAEFGYRIKLLGIAQRVDNGIEQYIRPVLVKRDSMIAQVNGVMNAIVVESDIVGELLMIGPGAGGDATASSVLGDIVDIAKSPKKKNFFLAFGHSASNMEFYSQSKINQSQGSYFIRLKAVNSSAIFSLVVAQMAKYEVSLQSVIHSSHQAFVDEQNIVMITYNNLEVSVYKAVEAIQKEIPLIGEPQVILIAS